MQTKYVLLTKHPTCMKDFSGRVGAPRLNEGGFAESLQEKKQNKTKTACGECIYGRERERASGRKKERDGFSRWEASAPKIQFAAWRKLMRPAENPAAPLSAGELH